MILSMIKADFLKIKRKWIWFLIVLGPLGVLLLQAANYGLRYDYLVKPGGDHWKDFLNNIHLFIPITLGLGFTIIASMTANIEHQQNAWKQLIAMPISKKTVYTAKFLMNLFLIFLSCFLLFLGTILLGIILKFGLDIPYIRIAKMSFFPFFAGIPILGIQVWLSTTLKNQALPLTIGILGAIFSMYTVFVPDWVIWKWPLLTSDQHDPVWFVGWGLVIGFIIFLFGMVDFTKRDVK
ncbi:ABC transporter permease [Heyndrickxia sp. NPDC080065]|uniref:ABC transporter permease n=1 Tax=Heyndrickxia sp. NPDC080065 TaxID=3390568 RepID=UPI003D05D51B